VTESDRILSNEQLVALFQEGDHRVFVILAQRMMPMLRVEASYVASRPVDNDDLVQEAMLALLTAAKRYDPSRKASFATYCRICVKHRLLNAVRSLNTPESPQEDTKLFEQVDRQGMDIVGFEDQMEEYESDAQLLKKLRHRLSHMEYRVLICHLAAYTYEEIAKLLGVPVKAVDNAMQRVRRKLSRWLT